MNKILTVTNLTQHFPIHKGFLRRRTGSIYALNGIDFSLHHGETIAIVGESGCGKSTLAKAIIRLIEPTGGTIEFQGLDITHLSSKELLNIRDKIQMVFQDPSSSLNPRKTVRQILTEPLLVHKKAATEEEALKMALDTLQEVGLQPNALSRFPHQFSGGQQQRIAIGRALLLRPELILLDEAVSSLDLSIQAQILNLLKALQKKHHLTYLFITHDLKVVERFADKVIVLYLGKIMESGTKEEIFTNPKHPYTQALLTAIPKDHPWDDKVRLPLKGELPSPTTLITGCPFKSRCPYAKPLCNEPPPKKNEGEHDWFCILD